MQMSGIWICHTYIQFSLFSAEIRFLVVPDLLIFISRSPTLYLGCSKPLSGGIIILT
ncbi:hypothetical protein BN1200_540054 [Klebsiella variicola]|nr:hypothetical protein BN1200_540054 [Klebsiella variicola]